MSLTKLIPSLLVATLSLGFATAPAKAQNIGDLINITDVDLDGVEIVDGVLTAAGGTVSGTIGGLPFTTEITDFALELVPDGGNGEMGCAVLHLELGPIDLDLLGLHVDTSPICLAITAFEGEGLLGDLLCALAGGDLGLLGDLLAVLPDILNGALSSDQAGGPPGGAEDICDGECEVLDLALGPVDLTLLGLNVHLDDCEDGPVQVCVSASEGEGLLGDLLCGLAGGGILPDLGNLIDLLETLADLEDLLEDLADLDATPRQVNQLVNQVTRALRDGELTTNELNKLVKSLTKLVR